MDQKLKYFLNSTQRFLRGEGTTCPSCGSVDNRVVASKYVITKLRRCSACCLLFRTPTTTPAESDAYYQSDYKSGLTTELPCDRALDELLTNDFAGSSKDFTRYIRILDAAGARPGQRVLDYGCSWGYGSWQLSRHGYDVKGFEVAKDRAEYARSKLSIDAIHDLTELTGKFDVIFTTHVLEHVPSVANSLQLLFSRLSPGGLLIAITPNGSDPYRSKQPRQWQRKWGLKHPNFLDNEYYKKWFDDRPYLITSNLNDLAPLHRWHEHEGIYEGPLDGWELLALCKNQRTRIELSQ